MTHQARDDIKSRNSFSSSQTKGDLREGKDDVLEIARGPGMVLARGNPCELVVGSFAAYVPGAQEDEAIADVGRVGDLVNREKQRPSLAGMGAECRAHFAALTEIEAVEWFVDEEDRMRREEADGEHRAFPFAFRERPNRRLEDRPEGEALDDLFLTRDEARPRTSSTRPSTLTAPESAGSTPATHSKSVVLPEPFGPIRPRTSPGYTENDTPDRAVNRPYRLVRSRTVTIGWTCDVERGGRIVC
jgi:hypothetical protein